MLKYLLDENVKRVYQVQLLRQEPDLIIRMVGDPGNPSRGTLDPEILIWCETHGYVLVTNNRASMPIHLAEHIAQNRHVPGILILNPNEWNWGQFRRIAFSRAGFIRE